MIPGERIVGVGVDLVELRRFRRILERTPSVVGRIFTDDEQRYATEARDPTERYAARFAAKEAVLKAMRVGIFDVPLTQIEVVRDGESSAPFVRLHGKAQRAATERGIGSWHVTMTHIADAAEALAVAYAQPDEPTVQVELFASTPATTVAFYEEVLGFVCEQQDDAGFARLRLGSIEVAVACKPEEHLAGSRVGLVIVVDDVDAWHQRVVAQRPGVAAPRAQPWGRRDFTLADPDGVPIRITSQG